jgi:hypothetical protein
MISDNTERLSYAHFMKDVPLSIELRIVVDQPVELVDFVSQFTAIASQYEKFIKINYPDLQGDAQIFVREMRSGSILADLIPWTLSVIEQMDRLQIVERFVRDYGGRILAYTKPGGRDSDANKGDLKDIMDAVTAISNDPDGRAELKVISYEDGKRDVRAHIQFSTKEAQVVVGEVEQHKIELDKTGRVDRERVLMFFKRTDKGEAPLGKRSGERVVIEEISDKDLALAYASNIAEDRIKDEIRHSVVYERGFIVDVNVQTKGGKPALYTVTHVHDIIDLPTD